MAARLKAAGLPASDMQMFAPPDRPKDGALIATLRGQDRQAKPILLLAHVDVVEAKREDWVRDPFKLVEEDGWFYARGASDDKAMAAVFTDSLIRYQTEGFKPRRDIKLALTCGEETPRHVQRRRLADPDAPGSVASGLRPQRRRGRRTRSGRQADRRCRSRLARRSTRTSRSRRPTSVGTAARPVQGQRHLSAGCRFVAAVGVDGFRSASAL